MNCFMEPLGVRELPDSTNYSVSGTKNQQVVPKKPAPKKKAPGSPALHLVLGTSYFVLAFTPSAASAPARRAATAHPLAEASARAAGRAWSRLHPAARHRLPCRLRG